MTSFKQDCTSPMPALANAGNAILPRQHRRFRGCFGRRRRLACGRSSVQSLKRTQSPQSKPWGCLMEPCLTTLGDAVKGVDVVGKSLLSGFGDR